MKIFRDTAKIPESYRHSVIALGNFDGLHLGHKAIITRAKKIAEEKKLPLAIMTFEPHPKEFFAKDKSGDGVRIYSLRDKLAGFKELGVDCVFLMRFNKKFTSLSADEFIRNILVGELKVSHVITGDNFCFGRGRGGDKKLLAERAREFSFFYLPLEHVENLGGEAVSSSSVRNLLQEGKVQEVISLLGCNYYISGRVRHGESKGRQLGFSTANIDLGKRLALRYGVYAVRVRVEGEGAYNAVANIGVKPTFGVYKPRLEVHLFDTTQNLYGKRLYVEFIDFIRPEQKFLSIEELKIQIAEDCKTARRILEGV